MNLEGVNFTLPEIQTLLDGVTVGGHSLQDETIALNQVKAWRFLFDSVERDRFSLAEDFVCELHGVLAQREALTWGIFRDGGVTIAGSDYLPPSADTLPACWQQLMEKYKPALLQSDLPQSEMHPPEIDIEQTYTDAISIFLQMARTQFFYDTNKRLGRLMMNGVLLVCGLPAINLPAKKQLEFNQLMLGFYSSNDEQPMQIFMRVCLEKKFLEIMSV
ncbi:hypothetical protein SPONN_2613 [uncultured Candidatus Thioglobus sp.]|nr:hypothetical protein SPONN_2613 [uncultured Candidatus Thioglobus sp.]